MSAQITVVHKRPGERARSVEVDPNDLTALQALVGGYLEALPFATGPQVVELAAGCRLLVNEDGRQKGLAPNIRDGLGRVLVGPLFVAKTRGSEFVTMSLAEAAYVAGFLDGWSL